MQETLSRSPRINQTGLRLVRDDITLLDVDAFVFYAQEDLALGTGFGTAVSIRGGPTIQKELDGLAPVAACEAIIASAGNLTAKSIIHAVGPRFQEEDIEGKLRTTIHNVLKRAEENKIQRIAFPAMGVGYYGIAPDVCATIMLDVISEHLASETSIKEVVICVYDIRQHSAFKHQLKSFS